MQYFNSVIDCNECSILTLIETYMLVVKFINHKFRKKWSHKFDTFYIKIDISTIKINVSFTEKIDLNQI